MAHAKRILTQISLFLLLLMTIVSGMYIYKAVTTSVVFCSSKMTENCRQCPEFGICENSDLKCMKNYIREGNECVEDQILIQKAYLLLHKVEDYVIKKSVNQYLMDRTIYYATLTEIKYLFQDNEDVNEKFLEFLMNNKAQRLVAKYFNNEEIFYAKEPFLGIVPLIQIFWEDNLYFIIAGFIITILLIFKLVQVKKRRDLQDKANNMYEFVRNQLKANVDDTPEHGVPEETLKEAIVGHLGKETAGSLWPIIENLRKNDKNVSKFEISLNGRPQILWQWNDVRSKNPSHK